MKKRLLIIMLLTLPIIAIASLDAKASFTVATFADPAQSNSNAPLFTVNYSTMQLTGGWDDSKTGLTLQFPFTGHSYSNAWFKVNSPITLTSVGYGYYSTSGSEIDFYQDNTNSNPLMKIQFDSGFMSSTGFGSNYTFANVTISGSEIPGTLSSNTFAFSFANRGYLQGSKNWNDGWTATASFTSSAVPEPATIGLLCLGGLAILRRKKQRQ